MGEGLDTDPVVDKIVQAEGATLKHDGEHEEEREYEKSESSSEHKYDQTQSDREYLPLPNAQNLTRPRSEFSSGSPEVLKKRGRAGKYSSSSCMGESRVFSSNPSNEVSSSALQNGEKKTFKTYS